MARPRLSIAASAPKLDVDDRFPLRKYYRTADNLLKQAHIYREEKNIVDLYILLLRFSSLVGETIPQHREYRTSSIEKRAEYTKKLKQVLLELEALKPEVKKQVEKLNCSVRNDNPLENYVSNPYEWPHVLQGPYLDGGIKDKTNEAYMSNGMSQAFEATSYTIPQAKSFKVEDRLNNLLISLPPPKDETLSRHSFLGPSGLRGRFDMPISQARVQYPSYIDTSTSDNLSWDQNDNKTTSVVESSNSTTIFDLDALQKELDRRKTDVSSQMRLTTEPAPPPVAAVVQSIPRIFEASENSKATETIPPWKVADPCPGPVSTKKEGSKQLYISTKMMDEFLKLAKQNTEKNLETCGVLAGSFRNATFYVTALLIPKQQATSDSCQTLNEEDIFDWQDKRGLFQLGWIHTHPKQTCFMSSVDLHTHYSYQVMLPEAIAIVMAPTDTTMKYGIFRLSDPGGLKVIQNCQMRGFHPHEQPSDGSPLYEHCGHVLMSSALKYDVIDLR